MGLFKKIDSGETTVRDGYLVRIIWITGIFFGILIGATIVVTLALGG